MSHVVEIQTEVRDPAAIRAAARRLALPPPVFGETQLYSDAKTGWAVQLSEWRYPVVCDVNTGQIDFDNFNGRWGRRKELNRFLQAYAVERTKIEARSKGHSVVEQPLSDGSIKLMVTVDVGVGGAA